MMEEYEFQEVALNDLRHKPGRSNLCPDCEKRNVLPKHCKTAKLAASLLLVSVCIIAYLMILFWQGHPRVTQEDAQSLLILASARATALHKVLKLPSTLPYSLSNDDTIRSLVSEDHEEAAEDKEEEEDQKVEQTECVLSILDAVTALAKAGVSINAAVKTCGPPSNKSLLPGVPLDAQTELVKDLCPVNSEFVFVSLSGFAVGLAGAVASCGEAAHLDAICAMSIMGLIDSLVDISATSQMIATFCGSQSLAHRVVLNMSTHRGQGDNVAATAPRRLYLGGGLHSMEAQCALDAVDVSIALAKLGVVLRNAIVKASCAGLDIPAKTQKMMEQLVPGSIHKFSEVYKSSCASDILAVLLEVTKAASLFSLLSIHCPPKLNLPALCGTGISALIAGLAGVAETSNGIFIACDQLPPAEKKFKRLKALILRRYKQQIASRGSSKNEQMHGAYPTIENESDFFFHEKGDGVKAMNWVLEDIDDLEMDMEMDEEIGDLSTRRLKQA